MRAVAVQVIWGQSLEGVPGPCGQAVEVPGADMSTTLS